MWFCTLAAWGAEGPTREMPQEGLWPAGLTRDREAQGLWTGQVVGRQLLPPP